jgi:hypothetical protein
VATYPVRTGTIDATGLMPIPGSAGSCWAADTWAANTWDVDAWAGDGEASTDPAFRFRSNTTLNRRRYGGLFAFLALLVRMLNG